MKEAQTDQTEQFPQAIHRPWKNRKQKKRMEQDKLKNIS
jgi:hypothetical protein